MKLLIKIVLSIIIVFIFAAAGGLFFLTRGLDSGSKLEVTAVNLSEIRDGVYTGQYDAGRWTNEVSVIIKDHKITKINIVKDITFPKPEWTKEILNKVIEKQSTNIDVVSGATVSSKAYLKAIENALKKGGDQLSLT
ncbi:MAG: FMN-binding protein [Clostridia bacterium]|nr:FMN-binding protein [Clostridia bacterium]